ncbi:MAG: aldehyde dehydrogenase [Lachnospiraceae bacterium]|nr:aldehyde dehydrogenase [Lachnospiraceae bacterium]
MQETEIKALLAGQRKYFRSKRTLPVDFRIKALLRLQKCIKSHEREICAALKQDLGKSATESYMCEVGLALTELGYMLKHVKKFAAKRHVATSFANFAASSFVKASPYGTVLIVSPWNYPFLLTIDPLIDAIAAGNTVVLKPSAYSPATSEVIRKIVSQCFPKEYVACVLGGRSENACLFAQKFDMIFFTGSQSVGKEVLKQAADHLTPVTLELGGKSPCIVDETANLKLAARRIVWGKFLNCGQTCVAPDYFYVQESVREKFVELVKKEIVKQFGSDPLHNESYGKIINQKHFARVSGLIDQNKVVHGGKVDATSLKIEPTVMDHVTWEDKIMQEEIFGPILPILSFHDITEVIKTIAEKEKPLALYIFSTDREAVRNIMDSISFGGGCINDVVVHLASTEMGFGGVGESGMGEYHGKAGFEAFSHKKSILDKKNWIDIPFRNQPYSNLAAKLFHTMLR